MLEPGTVVAGYRIDALLGAGGMGAVYCARQTQSDRVVALKLLADNGAGVTSGARLRREGRAQASLEHPHVVTVYDAGDSDQGPYLAMRLIDGPPLIELIRARELGARRALELLSQVADALDAAHAAGLVHRDVKPHNVLVGESDHAYLADFGLTSAEQATTATLSGGILGTAAYLAPEVVRGEEAGPASDRYGFAAMAFECLTGTVVFPRTSQGAALFAQANDPPPRIGARRPELGDGLDEVFARALAKEPAERQQSARTLVGELRRGLEQAAALDLPPPPPPGAGALGPADETAAGAAGPPRGAVPDRSHRGRRSIVLAALGGALILAAAFALLGGRAGEPAAALPADRPGLTYIGAELAGPPARSLDCRGRAPRPASPACTVVQSELPDATVVVPETGAIRDWQVRGAQGDLTLAVLRPREGGSFQVTTSNGERVGSSDVHRFETDLAVEAGDTVALQVAPGAAVGVRDGVLGAATERWLPPLAGIGRPADLDSGFDHELLLRVGLLPGGERRSPQQVNGSAATRLQAGTLAERTSVRSRGEAIDLELVELDEGFALDEVVDGQRVARIAVPDLRPGGQVVLFKSAVWAPDQVGLDLSFVNAGSARVIQHTYGVVDRNFQLLR